MGNMYGDSIKQWNVIVGCGLDGYGFNCSYCKLSFRKSMKRQKPHYDENGKLLRGCQDCYDFKIHFHEERLYDRLPKTYGDQFIWSCSSSDIYFAKIDWLNKIIKRMDQLSDRTFLLQSKNPIVFRRIKVPDNCFICTTIETDYLFDYRKISKAPIPEMRANIFKNLPGRKIITIEPILEFNLQKLTKMIQDINPERVYIGYNSKRFKSLVLPEPLIEKTYSLIDNLKEFTTTKIKHIPGIID